MQRTNDCSVVGTRQSCACLPNWPTAGAPVRVLQMCAGHTNWQTSQCTASMPTTDIQSNNHRNRHTCDTSEIGLDCLGVKWEHLYAEEIEIYLTTHQWAMGEFTLAWLCRFAPAQKQAEAIHTHTYAHRMGCMRWSVWIRFGWRNWECSLLTALAADKTAAANRHRHRDGKRARESGK